MSDPVISPDESERWLPVPGYEGLYEVSHLGRVRSLPRMRRPPGKGLDRRTGRMLKPIRRYYYVVGLCKDGKMRQRTVHGLVAEAFLGPRPPGLEVLHGPGGRYDNRLVNLSYGTHVENMADMRRDGTAKDHCARVVAYLEGQIRSGELAAGARLPRLKVIAAQHGVAMSTAGNAVAVLRRAGLVANDRPGLHVAGPLESAQQRQGGCSRCGPGGWKANRSA